MKALGTGSAGLTKYTYREENRIGDRICYISGPTKLRSHFPNFRFTPAILNT